ncbi:hypothetical protein [Flammeovirga pacifica]|uniref:Uncharacterized protein n=1 Tax=Flammeovirga pacifica TaxID=915059 RepID=A0A1S1Z255_FLAPC|nr:hypothetical protein [Flammeovirga pacifica]OHX67354.1 hypothetical protein NH26_13885 [Flammeovirga pacifica]
MGITTEIYKEFDIDETKHRNALLNQVTKTVGWTPSHRLVLSKIINFSWKKGSSMSNVFYAEQAGVSESSVNNCISKFKKLGVLIIDKAQSVYRFISINFKKLLELVYIPDEEALKEELKKEKEVQKEEQQDEKVKAIQDFAVRCQQNATCLNVLSIYEQKFILPNVNDQQHFHRRKTMLFKIIYDITLAAVKKGYKADPVNVVISVLTKSIKDNDYRLKHHEFVLSNNKSNKQ